MGSGYNSYTQIFQTEDQVVMIQEMGHHARTIPLDGRPHLHENIAQWAGNSRGRWEGDALVVETRNYDPRTRYSGASAGLVLVERFERIAPDVLRHEITLNDPDTWTRAVDGGVAARRHAGPDLRVRCHEGNYAMPGILAGARAEERAAAGGQ